jgi:uncharacterized membrane protein
MQCQSCQAVLPQDATYCVSCGSSQSREPRVQVREAQLSSVSAQNGQVLATGELLNREHEAYKITELREDQKKVEEGEEGEEENDNERLIVFSDGIIAFALTVAAITIKIPADVAQLEANGFSIVLRVFLYIVAFVIVAGSWNDHHTIFHHIKRNNIVLVTLNFFYLAATVLFPIGLFFVEFGIELLTIHSNVASSQLLEGGEIFLGSQIVGGLTLCAMWIYSTRRSRLSDAQLEPSFVSYVTQRLFSKPALLIFWAIIVYVIPDLSLPIIIVSWIARAIFFAFRSRKVDLTTGTDDTNRIQFFSDAVIGIAITLSVAQIEFPTVGNSTDSQGILDAVNNQGPLLHAFLVGIVVIGIYWLFHYHMFRMIKRHDSRFVFLNSFFLLDIALMLIPVNWLVNYFNNPGLGAYVFFGVWQMLTSLVLAMMWWRASRKGRLLLPSVSPRKIKQFSILVVANPLIFLLLTILSAYLPTVSPTTYIVMYVVALGVVWLFTEWLAKRRVKSQEVALG